jgi:FkbM family methyltransferase
LKRLRILFYRFIYAPPINFIIRNLFLLINKIFNQNLRISVSGKVSLEIQGNSFKLLTNESCHVVNYLFFCKPINYEFTPLFLKLINKSTVFFDLGANIGYFSVIASKINPLLKIYSFDPGNGAFYFLSKNVELNKCNNIHISKVAVSNYVGEIEFIELTNDKYPYLKYFMSGASSTVDRNYNLPKQKYKVEVTTLDEFKSKHGIGSIDLLKIDTEFNEHFVLMGASSILKNDRPIIICEVYNEIIDEIKHQLSIYKYIVYQYTPLGVFKINGFDEVLKSNQRNFIFVPEEKESNFIKEYL